MDLSFDVQNNNRDGVDEFFENRDWHEGSVANRVPCDEYEDHLPQERHAHKSKESRIGRRS